MKPLKKIKSGFLSRQISVGKLSLKTGVDFLKTMKESDYKKRLESILKDNVSSITGELHVMKGPIMKAGQMLSMYAGEILPDEARELLKSLENQSFYLEWDEIKKEIPYALLKDLEFEKNPLAAASLGQVHLAKVKSTNDVLAVKIQYRGVRKAIKNDVKSLRFLLKTLKLLPKTDNLDELFDEIKEMLRQETDYENELSCLVEYKEKLGSSSCFKVPKAYSEYSFENVLALEYMEGISLRDEAFLSISQDKRDLIGHEFLKLFLLELFDWGIVQTDAHLGNYLFDPKDERIVLLDFGACKRADENFLKYYREILKAAYELNRDLFFKAAEKLNYFDLENSNKDLLWTYFSLVGAPFESDDLYDWGTSDIPDKILKLLPRVLRETKLKSPPGDAVFIDRKVAGVFFFLKHIGARVNNKKVFYPFLYE